MNPYQILGVDRDSTPEQIKQAYRKLAAIHHPDKGGSAERFSELKQAHDILMDKKRRAEYDATGNTGKPRDIAQLARQMLAQTFNSLLQAHAVDPDIDYVRALNRCFRDAKAKFSTEKAEVAKHANRCEKLLINTEGEVLRGVIQGRLKTCDEQLFDLKEKIATVKQCQLLMKNCRCGADVERAIDPKHSLFERLAFRD